MNKPDVRQMLAVLPRLTVKELRAKYVVVFGEETPAQNKQWLIRRVAWRLQANAEGVLSERALRRAQELANEADLRLSAPAASNHYEPKAYSAKRDPRLPRPGTILTRTYKGQAIQVKIITDGFEYGQGRYPTLSAVAKAITGSHCNGYHFFRLAQKGGSR